MKKKKKSDQDYFVSSISETLMIVAMTAFFTLILIGLFLNIVT